LTIRTGYFSKAEAYAQAGYALVSIALKPAWFLPRHLRLFQLRHLAPTQELLFVKDDPNSYVPKYKAEVLSHLSADAILARLQYICEQAKTDKVVLLCWEAPGKFCHRHLVAEWLRTELGIPVCEVAKEELA
jgi:hypothetical protein